MTTNNQQPQNKPEGVVPIGSKAVLGHIVPILVVLAFLATVAALIATILNRWHESALAWNLAAVCLWGLRAIQSMWPNNAIS